MPEPSSCPSGRGWIDFRGLLEMCDQIGAIVPVVQVTLLRRMAGE